MTTENSSMQSVQLLAKSILGHETFINLSDFINSTTVSDLIKMTGVDEKDITESTNSIYFAQELGAGYTPAGKVITVQNAAVRFYINVIFIL